MSTAARVIPPTPTTPGLASWPLADAAATGFLTRRAEQRWCDLSRPDRAAALDLACGELVPLADVDRVWATLSDPQRVALVALWDVGKVRLRDGTTWCGRARQRLAEAAAHG